MYNVLLFSFATMQPNSALVFIPLWLLIALADSRTVAEENEPSKQKCRGCEVEQDQYEPFYRNLAEESMTKYLKDNNFDKYHKIEINKATKQVVAGLKYRIDFDAYLTDCDLDNVEDSSSCQVVDTSKYLNCNSEIWERLWLDSKEIKITCKDKRREKRQILGGVTEQDPKNPVYAQLATESLAIYVKDKGLTGSHKVAEVTKATTQVVAGSLTNVFFNAFIGSSNPINCRSTILEQPWLNVKNYTVTCDYEEEPEEKVPIAGGQQEQNTSDPIYYQLAEESFAKYKQDIGSTECHQLLSIEKVTVQVVAGYITKIDFYVRFVSTNDTYLCHSEIWEQSWVNRKDIDIKCAIN